jgi:hypothetical protein
LRLLREPWWRHDVGAHLLAECEAADRISVVHVAARQHRARRQRAVATAAPTQGRPVTERSPSVAAAGTDLTLSGNKSIAVDFGSGQDAFLRQSLDLT